MQNLFLAGAVMLSAGVLATMAAVSFWGGEGRISNAAPPAELQKVPWNGDRAYDYLKQICDLGTRRSGSPGMAAQQKLLTRHFEQLGAKVELQRFTAKHPLDGSKVPMGNLLVRWHPESKERILLCTHYDTRPYPSLDPVDRKGTFLGANDGASGVALLMELGREMPARKSPLGVDFAFFDGEEFVFDTGDESKERYFLGSECFARQYAAGRLGCRYRWAVLLDMVGGADLALYWENYSASWPDTRPLVERIWATAARLGVREFVARVKHEVRDDHLMLHGIARIPACDVIDLDYAPWHTQADKPDQCSATSLAKVGWVISEWLKENDK